MNRCEGENHCVDNQGLCHWCGVLLNPEWWSFYVDGPVVRQEGFVAEGHAVLVITRKAGQAIVINNEIMIKVDKLRGSSCKISVHASKDTLILRDELVDQEVMDRLNKEIGERKVKHEG